MKQQWKLTLLSMFVLALYQALDVGLKLQTLGRLRPFMKPETVKYSYIGDDRPAALPLRPRYTSMNAEWLDDRVYGIYADDDWASLIPVDSGFVDLGPNHDLFSLSMYHQLHCLDVMRHAFATAKAGVLHHVSHCLVYLREMVLCASDTTLEPADSVEHLGSTGDNVIHKCRDWTQIRGVVEANTAERMRRQRQEKAIL
ncbi:hypothetical protein BDZ97DRAFT_1807354 [Flammula alnicola]|nr:hypothetical protein BDZ97DRAFT_1807354 [Flammula alnicola]